MKILYVVQRYGETIVGGSEAACRGFAEKLTQNGHTIDVLTSCAHNYVDWSNEYPEGIEVINGVTVHRLPVIAPRTDEEFAPLHNWMMHHPGSGPLFEQQRWATAMGPNLAGQRRWLMDNAHHYDIVVFMTYLYATTTNGLPTVAGRVPTILQPTAHDEPPAYVSLYQSIFRQPDAFLFFTPEEREVVRRIYNIEPAGNVIGIGIDLESPLGDGHRFRHEMQLNDSPYLIYVGRLDGSKGVGELCRFFLAMKDRNPSNLKLVLAGGGNLNIPRSSDIIETGFLDEQQKRDAIAGALALVQSSYFESFSIVLCESWLQERPALVQGKCEVLRGQAMRSNGAIPYEGFAQFEASVDYLINNPTVATAMGRSGLQYVRNNYDWDVVISRFENTIAIAQRNFAERPLRFMPSR